MAVEKTGVAQKTVKIHAVTTFRDAPLFVEPLTIRRYIQRSSRFEYGAAMSSTFPVLWFNPKCSTCRKALELLKTEGCEPRLRLYLDEPPTDAELKALFAKLDGPAIAAVRRKEPEFAQAGLSDGSPVPALISAIIQYPRLLERPILEHADRATVGRPPERLLPNR